MGIVALRGPAIGMTLGHEYGTLRAVVRRRPLIVAPVDGSADGTTVDYALALAGRRGADVDLLHVVRPRGPSVFDNPDIALVGQTSSSRHVADPSDERALLERPTVTVGPEGTHIRNVTYKGEPGKAIAAYAQLSEAAAIIIGKYYGSPRWRRSGNIAVSLGRSAPIPVLIVPPPMDGDPVTAAAPFAHIVSAADFTVSSAVALRAALDIARASGGRVTLVHAMKDTPGRMVFSGFEALGAIDEIHAKAAKVAARLRRAIPASAAGRVDSRVTTGEPQRGILDVAAQVDADLIVIGVPPRSRFVRNKINRQYSCEHHRQSQIEVSWLVPERITSQRIATVNSVRQPGRSRSWPGARTRRQRSGSCNSHQLRSGAIGLLNKPGRQNKPD